ncbi:RecX family transcriptional regulator [Microbacterium lushaniae]|nr:RecX family transcriptional regulator [Microbacterium lushaniae]KAA9152616.1 RecX family transcriptional regulator [Microbacterium lushaniae]
MPAFDGGEDDRLAPVTPLFGAQPDAAAWHPAWRSDEQTEPETTSASEPASDAVADAERALLRRLRARQLSVSEARSFLLSGTSLERPQVDELIEEFGRRGYLDDAVLAEQLIHAATQRKGQGRRAIAQALSARGVPRDVSDAALGELPDDDAERALEFARTKARQLGRYDDDTALRRLMGQLARRGYPGSVAATAARAALAENRSGGGVRFR